MLFGYFYTSLFTNLPRPGDSEGTFPSYSQAATCPPVYHALGGFKLSLFIAGRQARKLRTPILIVFGLTRPGIELLTKLSAYRLCRQIKCNENYISEELFTAIF